MKTIKIIIACLMMVSAGFVISCKKSNTTTPTPTTDSDVSGASDNTYAENTSSDIVQIGAEATDGGGSLSNFRISDPEEILSACATVLNDTTTKIVTVTFNGGVCLDGRVRTGQLIFNYAASPPGAIYYRDPGFTFTVTAINYTVDSNIVNVINKTVTNITPANGLIFNPATTNEMWNIVATIQIIKTNADTINWTGYHLKTLLNTSDPTVYHGDSATSVHISWDKAIVGITGSRSGTVESGSRSGGETFTLDITSQLVRDFTCRPNGGNGRVPFINGVVVATYSDKKYPRTIDYGAPNNGACDLIASVTINGNVYYITLP